MQARTRKILVAMNNSVEPVRQAIRLADKEKAWLTVLKVLPTYDGDLDFTGISDIRGVMNSGKEKTLQELKKLAAEEGALIKTRLEYGEIWRKIVEVAAEERCDLIVMGNTPAGYFTKIMGGTLAEQVRRLAHCPVVEVMSDEGDRCSPPNSKPAP